MMRFNILIYTTVKFILDNILFIGLAFLSGGILLFQSLQQRGNRVSAMQAIQMMNKNKALVLDVRPAQAFEAGTLKGATNIPLAELAQRSGELNKFKDKSIIVVCQRGTHAGKAESLLKKAGFNDISCLQGGIAAWQAENLPVVTSVKEKK